MQLKSKLIALASGIALVASMGVMAVTFAEPAAAITDVHMCAFNLGGTTQCAVEHGLSRNITMNIQTSGNFWNVPTSGSGEIVLTSSSDCMQVVSGNTVQLKACSGASSQEFSVTALSNGDFVFRSHSVSGDCLNDHYQVSLLNVAPCTSNNRDQEFSLP